MELRDKKPPRGPVEERAEAGALGAQTAIAADSPLLGALGVGQRRQAPPRAVVHAAKQRLRPGSLPALCPEAEDGDASAILDALGRRSPAASHGATGQARRPIIRGPPGGADGQVTKQYTGRGSERGDGRVGHGQARLKPVGALLGSPSLPTSAVERQNGTSRVRNQRKGRQPLACSTASRSHRWMRGLAVGLDHGCPAPRSLQSKPEGQVSHRSPALAATLADHLWATEEGLLCPVLGG